MESHTCAPSCGNSCVEANRVLTIMRLATRVCAITCMRGNGAACVLESKHPDYPVGSLVMGPLGWRRYLVSDGNSVPLT